MSLPTLRLRVSAIVLNGATISVGPVVVLAAFLLHTGGAAPFHAHGVEDLRAPVGRSHMGAAAF